MKNYFFCFLKIDDRVIIFGPATDVLKLLVSLCRFVSGTSNVVSSANMNNVLIMDKDFRSLAIIM